MQLYFETVLKKDLTQYYFLIFLVTIIFCSLIISFTKNGLDRRGGRDLRAIQSAHTGFVPRLGGLAVYLGTLSIVPISFFSEISLGYFTVLILSPLPIFVVGIFEDLGFYMHPARRLGASVVSGCFVIIFYSIWLSKLAIPGIDQLLSFAPIGVIFTLFATAGVVNAFNLIDGLNGLSSYIAISTALALSIAAFEVNNVSLAIFLIMMSVSVLGFFIFNFPFAKIFLGDAGAYTIGHVLVWCSIMLVTSDTTVSSFAILLIFFWPVADTLLAIWRRWKLGNPAGEPDRLHFHQLVMRLLEIRFFGRNRRYLSNPLATLALVPMISIPQSLGVFFLRDVQLTFFFTLLLTFLFFLTYALMVKTAKKRAVKY